MTPDDFVLNPLKFYAKAMAATIDMSRAMVDASLRQVESSVQRAQDAAASAGDRSWSDFAPPTGEESMREMFHYAADLNLRAWSHAAELMGAMPAWTQSFYTAPGTMLTDWFDRLRERESPFMPANDFWAVAPDAPTTSTPAKTETKPAKPASAPKSKPKSAAKAKKTAKTGPAPIGLKKPVGQADDLTQIKGVGAKMQEKLNGVGVFHLEQIADWTSDTLTWVDEKLALRGRAHREAWIDQARDLKKAKAA